MRYWEDKVWEGECIWCKREFAYSNGKPVRSVRGEDPDRLDGCVHVVIWEQHLQRRASRLLDSRRGV